MPRILFLHGLRGSPAGLKVQRLQSKYGTANVVAPPLGFGRRRADGTSPADLLGAARLLFDGLRRAVDIAGRALCEVQPDVIVGTSLGGGIALHLETGSIPLVLVAPAWKKSSLVSASSSSARRMLPWPCGVPVGALAVWLARRNFPDWPPRAAQETRILHAPADPIIPIADSRELLAASGLPPERLIEVGTDHAMNGDPELDALLAAVRLSLSQRGVPA